MQLEERVESPRIAACATTADGTPGDRLASQPVRHRLTTLFVDIAGSTSLLVQHPPETVLGVVQCFMRLVTDVAYAYAGAVKDYEGDGALLYFASTRDAVRAALAIRAELAAGWCDAACGGGPGVAVRMSLTVGDVVVGWVGSPARHAVALVGPSVNIGARLLKQIPEGGIIAGGEIVEALRLEARPSLMNSKSAITPFKSWMATESRLRPTKSGVRARRGAPAHSRRDGASVPRWGASAPAQPPVRASDGRHRQPDAAELS